MVPDCTLHKTDAVPTERVSPCIAPKEIFRWGMFWHVKVPLCWITIWLLTLSLSSEVNSGCKLIYLDKPLMGNQIHECIWMCAYCDFNMVSATHFLKFNFWPLKVAESKILIFHLTCLNFFFSFRFLILKLSDYFQVYMKISQMVNEHRRSCFFLFFDTSSMSGVIFLLSPFSPVI